MPQTDIFLSLSKDGFDLGKKPAESTIGSTDVRCPGAIEVLAVKHGIVQVGSEGGGRPRSVEEVHHEAFRIKKAVDPATPKLFKWCSMGEFIAEAKLSFFSASGGYDASQYPAVTLPGPCLTYIMTYVHVSSIELEAEEEGVPVEWIGLKYGQLEVRWDPGAVYVPETHADNTGEIKEIWSQVLDAPVAAASNVSLPFGMSLGGNTHPPQPTYDATGDRPEWANNYPNPST